MSKYECYDNKEFSIVGRSFEKLEIAVKIAFFGKSATHYRIDEKFGLIFYWHEEDSNDKTKLQLLPYKLTDENAFQFILEWYKSVINNKEFEKFAGKADNDVFDDVMHEYGWRIYQEFWGKVGDDTYSFCAFKPHWLWLGK